MRRNNGWRALKGRWTRSIGERGVRVRLFQTRRDGVFYRAVWVAGAGVSRKSLGTHDKDEAERLGRALLAELLTQGTAVRDGALTLGILWSRFKTECVTWRDNAASTQRDGAARAEVLLAWFGDACDVRTLTAHDIAAYSAARKAGGLVTANGRRTRAVRGRAVQADLLLLKAMCRWATTVRIDRGGRRLLDRNPLDGITFEREKNPRRPIATWERFTKTREAIARLRDETEADLARRRWTKLELVLVLAEATGRRLGAIRQLRWEDVDLTAGRIRWRAEHDKQGRESVVPIPAKLVEELKRLRAMMADLGGIPAVRGLVCPSETDADRPADRYLFNKWLARAERTAGLDKLKGSLWHAYRRAWATTRKHHPLKDVAAAGGWKDINTLLTCYTQPDAETLLAVMSEERKVREISAVAGTGS